MWAGKASLLHCATEVRGGDFLVLLLRRAGLPQVFPEFQRKTVGEQVPEFVGPSAKRTLPQFGLRPQPS